jgi:hypothetical protein
MTLTKKLFASLLVVIFFIPFAHADLKAYAFANAAQRYTDDSGSSNNSSITKGVTMPGFGGGYVLDLPAINLEFGAEVYKRQAEWDSGRKVSYYALSFPIIARFTLLPLLDIGAGAYALTGLGNVETEDSGVLTKRKFDDEKLKKLDYGLLATVGFSVALFYFDLRFQYGIADLNDSPILPNRKIKYHETKLVAGIRF